MLVPSIPAKWLSYKCIETDIYDSENIERVFQKIVENITVKIPKQQKGRLVHEPPLCATQAKPT
jgi:hypothetical protein